MHIYLEQLREKTKHTNAFTLYVRSNDKHKMANKIIYKYLWICGYGCMGLNALNAIFYCEKSITNTHTHTAGHIR